MTNLTRSKDSLCDGLYVISYPYWGKHLLQTTLVITLKNISFYETILHITRLLGKTNLFQIALLPYETFGNESFKCFSIYIKRTL